VLKQPKTAGYYDGFNERLYRQVPSTALRIVEVGCARGRLGFELKQQDPRRTVIGIEWDVDAAEVARTRLDEVWVCDLQREFPDIEPGSVDCVIFGDVLEHLYDPEAVLRAARTLLAPEGSVLVCVPNITHFSIVKALLRADPMYQPAGLLDATHIRFFSHATFIKMLLDVGLLPDLVDTVNSGGTEHMIPAATALLEYFRVPPSRALKSLDAYQYIFAATKLPDVEIAAPVEPISFAVLVNDEDQLNSNLLRSPCLWEGTAHQLMQFPNQASAADGLNAALAAAEHDVVVLVQQDMYLPHGWDRRFRAQYAEAQRAFGPLGVGGLFGMNYRSGDVAMLGRAVDRDSLLDLGRDFPRSADAIDEILLAIPRDTPLRADPSLGFHLYGADLCLAAAELGLTNVVLDAPAYHNSLFADVDMAFHTAREVLLEKWAAVRPLHTNMGRLDTAVTPAPPPAQTTEPADSAELDDLRRRLLSSEQRLAAVLGSRTWRIGSAAGRLLRRR
jgi:SAM-dependent methyltransferase